VHYERSAIAYCYCDHADGKTLEAPSIIGTLIQQLLIVKSTIDEIAASMIRKMYHQGLGHPPFDKLIDLLCHIIGGYDLVYIVIDGLDEAETDS